MCAFVATNKAPGVYIDEVQLPGPIAGVGTSTAAFVGRARAGETGVPFRLQSWTAFVEEFGVDGDPYLTTPMVFVTSAVRGFFENGGADCWFVRVGTAKRSSLALMDRSAGAGDETLIVKAKHDGAAGDAITVEVQDASIAATKAARASATIANAADTTVTVTDADDAKEFFPGDIVVLDDGTNNEIATIASVTDVTLTLVAPLSNGYGGGAIRIADLAPGQQRVRVEDSTGFEPGTNARFADAADKRTNVLSLAPGLENAYGMDQGDPDVDVATQEFTLVIGGAEKFTGLSVDQRHSRYVLNQVTSERVDVALPNQPNPTPPPENMPRVMAAAPLAGGADDDPAGLDANLINAGVDALQTIDEVNVLCIPDSTAPEVQTHMIDHCELMQERFAILDPQPGASVQEIRDQRANLGSDRGFAAIYYPRIVVSHPTLDRITIPPSGHLAGLYARVDNDRGVFKAPANAALRGVLDLERRLDDLEQGPLNEAGINVIRRFPGRGILAWGARTISTNTNWRYVNVRRLLLFIEESLQEGTQFVVFEPNDNALWEQVKRQVTEFLTRIWTDGGLVGATAEQAFRVRVDEELNPPASRALGILVIEVRVAPTTPAEFVVFRIIQQPGRPLVEE
jgi:phage tail sheath protein FI